MLHMAFIWTYYRWKKFKLACWSSSKVSFSILLHIWWRFSIQWQKQKPIFISKLCFLLVSLPFISVCVENDPECKGNNYKTDLFAIIFFSKIIIIWTFLDLDKHFLCLFFFSFMIMINMSLLWYKINQKEMPFFSSIKIIVRIVDLCH